MNKKQQSCDGRGGAQRPVGRGKEPKKTGARSARARTRGQNPLVNIIVYLGYFVCLCVIECVCVSQFVAERSAILLVLIIKLTKRRYGGFGEGGIEMERYGKGQIGEGGCEYAYNCLSQT